MKISRIETYTVSVDWKNWLFVKVSTDDGLYGIGEATMNGFIKTTEAAIHELKHFVLGKDPRQVTAVTKALLETIQDGGHIHRLATAGIEVACWDILGKSLGAPIYQLLGGKVRDSVLGYANGWYRGERSATTFLALAEPVAAMGFHALKIDPFGAAHGTIDEPSLQIAHDILAALRDRFGSDFKILIDVHCRFMPSEALRIARRLAPLDLYWWEEPTTAEREELTNEIASQCPITVATGEQFDRVGQFMTLAQGGHVSIFQPEPMCLGGISNTLAVASIARANGAWIAPHQSGGPVASAVCLQLAACVPNFLIQEHFDPFNAPWTQDLVTWHPAINPQNGHLSLPEAPGLGLDLNLDVVREHPYDPDSYFDGSKEGWEKRLGSKGQQKDQSTL
jgi:galactonate dehydratase